jgi:DNA-binding MarR family transcriptional regulator
MKIEEVIKQKSFHSPHQKVFLNIMYTSAWLYAKQREYFKQFDITPQQYNVLRILKGQYPNSISTCDIRDRMIDPNSDVSRLVDRMEKMELVTRTTCKQDKRRIDVVLSPKGQDLLDKIGTNLDQLESNVLLSSEEAEILSNMLDKMRGTE